jgi:hypothetical protein
LRKPTWLPSTDPRELVGQSADSLWTVRLVRIAPGILHIWFTDRPVDLAALNEPHVGVPAGLRALQNPHPHMSIDVRHAPDSSVWIPLSKHPELAACLADALSLIRKYPWPSHDSVEE